VHRRLAGAAVVAVLVEGGCGGSGALSFSGTHVMKVFAPNGVPLRAGACRCKARLPEQGRVSLLHPGADSVSADL